MSGVRVSWLPNNCQEKDIKIHFSKRENGGGQIQNVFYPMLNGDAVIIFEDDDAADGVLSVEDHKFNNTNFVGVTKLPSIQAFPVIEAKLDPAVAVLLQTERKLRDEIQYKFYNENVEFIKDEDGNIEGIRGNWYLLEWTWAYIDNVIKRQHGDMSGSQRTLFTETQRQDYRDELAEAPMISLPSSGGSKIPLDGSIHHKGTKNIKGAGAGTDKTEHKKHAVQHDPEIEETGMAVYEPEDEPSPPTDIYPEPVGTQRSDLDIVVKGSTDDVCSLEFTFGPLTVNVFVGSITKAETDVIVNAAMGPLIHGAGVAYALAKAASPEMERQCKDYVAKHGAVEEGEVMHTCAGGDLSNQVKYIIHAVGPIWSGAYPDRSSALLTRTFLNSLKYANDHLKVNSMTMPLISSGIFGMPLELCVQSFLNAIVLFRDDCDRACLSEVNLVNNNPDNTAMTVLHLRNLISQGADKLITDAQLLLQSASTSYTTHRGGRQRDEEDDSTYSNTGTSDRYVVPVRGQKLSSETSPVRRTVDVEDRRMTSPGGATASGGAYQYSSDRQSKPKERSPGPPTTSYAYSAESTRGLSGSTYNPTGRTTDVHTTRQSSFGNGGSLLSSGSRSFTSSSSRASTSGRPLPNTGRPLPNTPSGVKPYASTSSSKRY